MQCLQHSHCPGQACDSASDVCVPCLVQSGPTYVGCTEESSPPYCKTAPLAANNECVDCLSNEHCLLATASRCGELSNECESCDADSDCGHVYGKTVCDTSGPSGECVQCTDSQSHCLDVTPTTPICDANECRACRTHADCDIAGGVCNRATGECLEESEVIYVDKDDGDCASDGGGTRAAPFCVLQDGVDEASSTARDVILVEARDVDSDSYMPITMSDAGTVWIVGRNGAKVSPIAINISVVYVTGETDLTVDGLELFNGSVSGVGMECDGSISTQPSVSIIQSDIHDNNGGGVDATDCTVTLDSNTITDNNGGGVDATDCTVTLDSNTITGNNGGGISLSSCGFVLMNNFVTGNGPTATVGGVRISGTEEPRIFEYNTVAGNFVSSAVAGGIRCDDPVEIRNSIVYGNTNDELESDCVPRSCLIEDTSGADGDNNIREQSPSFVNAFEGNYHIEDIPPSVCIDAADQTWTVDHDVDNQTRPQGGGYDIGADEAG